MSLGAAAPSKFGKKILCPEKFDMLNCCKLLSGKSLYA
jgi:hypothetical protein